MPQNYGPYYQPALTGSRATPEAIDIMSRYMEAPQPSMTAGRSMYTPYIPYTPPSAPTQQTSMSKPALTTLSNPAIEGAGISGAGEGIGVGLEGGYYGGGVGNLSPAGFGGAALGGFAGSIVQGGDIGAGILGATNAVAGYLGNVASPQVTQALGLESAPPQHNPLTELGLTPSEANLAKGALTTGAQLLSPYATPVPSVMMGVYNAITGQNISRDVAAVMLGPLNAILGLPVIGPFLTGLVSDPLAAALNAGYKGIFGPATLASGKPTSQQSIYGGLPDQAVAAMFAGQQVDISNYPGAVITGPAAEQAIDTSEYGGVGVGPTGVGETTGIGVTGGEYGGEAVGEGGPTGGESTGGEGVGGLGDSGGIW